MTSDGRVKNQVIFAAVLGLNSGSNQCWVERANKCIAAIAETSMIYRSEHSERNMNMHAHASFGCAGLFPGLECRMWAMFNSEVNNWLVILRLK